MTEEKKTAITKPKKQEMIQADGIDKLLQIAVKNKAGVEPLKELMKMKYEHEEREARKSFHVAFCKMQAEFPAVKKTKEVRNKHNKLLYSYAPLEQIVLEINPYMEKHGFSKRWSESSEREGYKRVTCHVTHIDGHSESSYVDVPIQAPNDLVNKVQQTGSSSTYGKRYSLCGALGIMVDDDDDGKSSQKQAPVEKPKQEPKKEEPKNVTPEPKGTIKNELIDDILENLKILGCKTVKECQEKTGIKHLSDAAIELLKEIKDRLAKEVMEIPDHEKPLADDKLSFDDPVDPEGNINSVFEKEVK